MVPMVNGEDPAAGILRELAVALVAQYEGAAGNYMRRHPSAISADVNTACRALEQLGDSGAVPGLRALLQGLPKHAKGSKTELTKVLDRLEGRYVPPEDGNRLVVSPDARASCRACTKRFAKGELRLGTDALGSRSEEAVTRWYHLACGVAKSPAALIEALRKYPGEVPERAELTERAERLASPDGA
jgi:hypothetical protein